MKKLNEDQKNYERTIYEINYNKVDIEKKKNVKNYKNEFDKYENEISEIIKDENSKYIIFLKKKAKQIINPNKKLDISKCKEIEEKLVNYMIWKKANEDIKKLIKKRRKRN